MNITDILTIVSSYGFPIVACLLMGWYVTTRDKQHKEEVDKLRETVDNNTHMIERLVLILSKGGVDLDP